MNNLIKFQRTNRQPWQKALAFSLREDLILILIAITYFLTCMAVGHLYHFDFPGKNKMLISIDFFQILFSAVGLFLVSILCQTAYVMIRSNAPFNWLIWTERCSKKFFTLVLQKNALFGFFLIIFLVCPLFAITQNFFKIMIPIIEPFKWDPSLANIDQKLFGGTIPYNLLPTSLYSKPFVHWIDIWYTQYWFFISMMTVLIISFHPNRVLRQRFFMSNMLCWVLLGTLTATYFSSVGPIFFHHFYEHNLNPYQETFSQLMAANKKTELNTVFLHNLMIKNIKNPLEIIPISAFPSLHAAITTLYVLLWHKLSKPLWYFGLFFWCIIMFGSVFLMWHYAIDSIVGALGAWCIWKLAKPLAQKQITRSFSALSKSR